MKINIEKLANKKNRTFIFIILSMFLFSLFVSGYHNMNDRLIYDFNLIHKKGV